MVFAIILLSLSYYHPNVIYKLHLSEL